MTTINQLPQIGTKIEATRPADSFYKKVRGTVTGYRNGFIMIQASEVISKWESKWSEHPTSCAIGVHISDVIA